MEYPERAYVIIETDDVGGTKFPKVLAVFYDIERARTAMAFILDTIEAGQPLLLRDDWERVALYEFKYGVFNESTLVDSYTRVDY